MITELEILAILGMVAEARGRLGRDEVRAATILASVSMGALVRFDQLLDYILTLRRRGFLDGDLDGPGGLMLTLEGTALLQAMAERRIGGSRMESLRIRAEPLRSASSTQDFIQRFGPQVTELVKAQRSKQSPAQGEVVLCAMLVSLGGFDTLHETHFPLPQDFQGDEANPWPAIHRAESRLSSQLGRPVHMTIDRERLLAIAPEPMVSVELDGRTLRGLPSRDVEQGRWSSYIVAAAGGFFADRLTELGYLPVGSRRRVFVRYGDRGAGGTEASIPAVRFFYQALGPRHVLAWVEEFSKPWTRVLDLLAGARDREEMGARLEGQRLRTLPYERPARLVDIVPELDLAREMVPGTSLNYTDYWADLGVDLEERVQPLLLIETKTGQYHYPAEAVLVRSEAPELLGGHEPLVIPPEERLRGLQELAGIVFKAKTVAWRGLSFSLGVVAPAVGDLPAEHRPRTAFINPPLLRFADGSIGTDPLDIFAKGPEAGRKRVVVRNLYYPSTADPGRCTRAAEALCRHYGSRGLGEARLDPDLQRVGYPPGSSRADIGGLVRRTAKAMGDDSAAIAFLDEGEEAYHGFKRFYPEYTGSPLQAIQLETTEGILSGRRGILDQLALNLYLKRLGPRESAWSLLSPADGAARTTYLAIAFSRRLEPARGGKGVAALHDAVGRGLNWGLVMTPGERTITQAWFETVLDQIQPMLEGEPFDRLVLYRTGRLDPVEVDAIDRALTARFRAANKAVDFVAIMDEHRRFFVRSKEGLSNPPPGTAIFWSESEVLLAESGFVERGIWRGTVVPVGLRRVLGSTPVDRIAAEYHDLTHLSWSAPSTTWKHPLVMKIAERLAEAAREGVPSNAIKTLPL